MKTTTIIIIVIVVVLLLVGLGLGIYFAVRSGKSTTTGATGATGATGTKGTTGTTGATGTTGTTGTTNLGAVKTTTIAAGQQTSVVSFNNYVTSTQAYTFSIRLADVNNLINVTSNSGDGTVVIPSGNEIASSASGGVAIFSCSYSTGNSTLTVYYPVNYRGQGPLPNSLIDSTGKTKFKLTVTYQ